jgi:hypothetical protein
MTIKRWSGPVDGLKIVQTALQQRRHRAQTITPLGGAPQSASPLPMYHLGINDVERPDFLQRATQTGWRYPVLGGIQPGLAIITERPGGVEYEGLTYGTLAQRLIQASLLAQQALGSVADQYEPRMLDVPGAHLVALWLAGAQNQFISLMDGNPPGSAALSIVDDIQPRLIAAVRARANVLPSGGSKTPTN